MSFEEAEVLRERALEFLRVARRLFEEGSYDLAAFGVEQYCQLMLKYRLLVSAGAYPRTHSIVRLLRELSKLGERAGVLLSGENVLMVARIEDAHIGSRCLPRRYLREEVDAMLRFVEGVFRPVVEGF